jgi:AraC family transcriptional regulator
MKNREAIYASIDTIEEKIDTHISVAELAKLYGFSSYYYSRLFKGITGVSPKQYIHGRKLSLSATDLLEQDVNIIDIAFKYGFGSHEVYTRAFQKMFGVLPSEVRRQGSYPSECFMNKLTPERIEGHHHLVNTKPTFVSREEIKLVGIPLYHDIHLKNDLSEPWSHLMHSLETIKHKLSPCRFYQMQFWFEDQEGESMYFFIAVEVSHFENTPLQFTEKVIPKQDYLMFQHKGFANKVGYTYRYIYEDYLPNTAYQLPHMFNFEYYGKQHLGPYNRDSISEIYIPVSTGSDKINQTF